MKLKAVLGLLLATGACHDAAHESRTTVTYERVEALRLQAVDNNSDYMLRFYAHVGPDQAERSTDPIALGAGVSAKADLWTAEGKHQLQRDYYLEAADRGLVSGRTLLENYFHDLAARDPSFVVPASRELVFEQFESGRWRSYYVDKHVALDGNAVESAHVGDSDRPEVMVDLTEDGGRALGKLTNRIAGHKLAIISGGTVMVAPIVNDAIYGGRFAISITGADAEATAVSLVAALDRD